MLDHNLIDHLVLTAKEFENVLKMSQNWTVLCSIFVGSQPHSFACLHRDEMAFDIRTSTWGIIKDNVQHMTNDNAN